MGVAMRGNAPTVLRSELSLWFGAATAVLFLGFGQAWLGDRCADLFGFPGPTTRGPFSPRTNNDQR